MRQFIVYACPTGILAEQLSIYFAQDVGKRRRHTADRYIPYCALTELFYDQGQTIPLYLQALDRLHEQWVRSRPHPGGMTLTPWMLQEGYHGLELEAPWLRQMMVQFVCQAHSPSRQTMLRLKTWLPLYPLYDLDGSNLDGSSLDGSSRDASQAMLPSSAQDPIHLPTSAGWDLCFYEQRSPFELICHRAWPLQPYTRPAENANLSSRLSLAGQLAIPNSRPHLRV